MKKKILIIPSWYPNKDNPGLGTFFREQAALFEDEFDIRVFTGHLNTDISRTKKLENTLRYTLLKKVSVQKTDDYFLAPPAVYGFEYLKGLNRFEKINYEIIFQSWLEFLEKYILPNWKPDLIHAHDTFFGGIIANIINEKWGIPYIITEHNNFLYPHPDFIKIKFFKAIRNSKIVLLVSEYQKRMLLSIEPKTNTSVVGNFISEHFFNVSVQKKSKPFKILYVGRYDNLKDYDTLLSTIIKFSELINQPDYLFEIVGCGDNGKQVIMLEIEKHNLQNHCKIHSYVSRDDIPLFYHDCDVVLNTSISETFGLVAGEAMMCGKPVVSTNSGGFDEMYIPGVNGIKCAIGDTEGLARALLSVYNQKIKFDPFEIRESVINKFGSEAFKAKISRFYG